jgi:hypothetical protein
VGALLVGAPADSGTQRTFAVSGYHHNVRRGFMSLKPGIFATGAGEARFRDFKYRVPQGQG